MIKKEPEKTPKLFRSETDRIIGGVAGGIGKYFKIDPLIIRLVFLLLFFSGAAGLLIYLTLWLIIPSQGKINQDPKETIKEGVGEIRGKAEALAKEVRRGSLKLQPKLWIGILLITAGIFLFLDNFGFFRFLNLTRFWPLLLIFLGVLILNKRQNS